MCYKELSFRDFQKILNKNGYGFVRRNGSHCIFHNENGRQLVINVKPKQGTIVHLIKEYGLVW